MLFRLVSIVCLTAVLSATNESLQAENWPQWRGPRGDGTSAETDLPIRWSKTENVAWRTPLPGPGGSTPVIWEDRIFVTSADGDDLVLLCLSTEGEILWKTQVHNGNQPARGEEGNSASPSPVTDGQRVWVFFGTGMLACYDFDGNEVWKFNVQDRYGKFAIQFGMTSTPVLDGNALYLQLIHGEMNGDYTVGKVIKLDKATGKEIWAVDRRTGAIAENKHSYASPILYEHGGERALVTHGADHTIAYDLESGKELWRLGGLNGPSDLNETPFDRTLRFVASPVARDGLIVIPTAKRGPVVALNPEGARGKIDPAGDAIAWTHGKTPDVPCPLILNGLVFCCLNDGQMYCVDAESGEVLYHERTHNFQHRASPVYADGRIYTTARDGHFTVLQAGPEFKVLAENELGEAITASPAISNGVMYLRTFNALYAVSNGSAADSKTAAD
jgi:outer membrane protein assembly factor BamB